MHDYKIPLLSGGSVKVKYDTYQDAVDVVNANLETQSANINSGWLTTSALAKNKYNIENRVKFLLDCLGYLLLQAAHLANQTNGITSLYKENAKRERELPCDFQSDEVFDNPLQLPFDATPPFSSSDNKVILQSDGTPKKVKKLKVFTRSEKIRRIRKQYGRSCQITFATVDTENLFSYDGYVYEISQELTQYQPKQVKDDLLYDMDQIVIVKSLDGRIGFYDASLEPLPDGAVFIA